MNKKIEKYLSSDSAAYYLGQDGRKYAHSVHFKSQVRYKKALEEANKQAVPLGRIIALVSDYLHEVGITTSSNPIYNPREIDYLKIKDHFGLESQGDLLWMKFTKDGYLGVVAASDDINFDIPGSQAQYNDKNSYGSWKHNTSGILVHSIGKVWDKTFALIFPLANIPDGYSKFDLETAVGNLLIENKVPIIDYYSHVY